MRAKPTTTMRTSAVTVRVPVELKKRLESLAKSRSSNRSRLAVEAIQSYVDDWEEHLARIDRGIRDADEGRLVPHSQVKRYLQSWGRIPRRTPPVCK